MERFTVRRIALCLALAGLMVAGGVSAAFAIVGSTFTWFNQGSIVRDPDGAIGPMADLSGDYLVYSTNADKRLHAYNFSDGTSFDFTDTAGEQLSPSVDGGLMACEETFTVGAYSLVIWNLSSATSVVVTTTANRLFPAVSDGLVVFLSETSPGSSDVFSYSVEKDQISQLTQTGGITSARVWKGQVAFTDSTRVSLLDLKTGSSVDVTTSASSPIVSDFDEGVVAYDVSSATDYRNIAAFDLANGLTYDVASTHLNESNAMVCGRQIVYSAAGIDPVVTVGGFCYDMGTDDTELCGEAAGFVSGADANSFLFYDMMSSRGLYLYTPNRPRLTAKSVFSGTYGTSAFVSGVLSDRGIGLAQRPLRMQSSTDGIRWSDIGAPTTGAGGAWEISYPTVTRKTYFRAVYDGGSSIPSHISVNGEVAAVNPKAKVGTPPAPLKMRVGRTYTINGAIAPIQLGESPVGYIEAYRKYNGRWTGRKAFVTSFTASGYQNRVKLSTRGTWRMRFMFSGSECNAAAVSGWRTVTVY